jgi:hypothetical protein
MWPEIYFCDYNDAVAEFNISLDFDKSEGVFFNETAFDFNPDYLGFYSYNNSNEGIIILFKDRIVKSSIKLFSKFKKDLISLDDTIKLLKTNVLIHEIGHWLTHSCVTICNNDIRIHFGFLHKIIIETMAQLTVVWSCNSRKNSFECNLENFSRLFMPMQPYPYYEFHKVNHLDSPEIILKRYWGIASQMTHLNEDDLFRLLAKKDSDLSVIELKVLKGKLF